VGQLIDSNVFIDLERRGDGPSFLREQLGNEPIAMAAISASELLVAIYFGRPAERRARRESFVEEVLTSVTVLPFDLPVARIHAQI